MAKGEFGMLYLCAGGGEGGAMIGKNKEIIIAHPLDKLWMLPNYIIKLKPPEWNHGYVIRRQDFIEK